MAFLSKFIKLMKGEPARKPRAGVNQGWVIDESKCLSSSETRKLRQAAMDSRERGLDKRRFNWIRDWFMIELGLNAGLRVAEMTALRHGDLLIDAERSSVRVLGKGHKRRAVWIGQGFKNVCQRYLILKAEFGYSAEPGSFLLVNLNGHSISKRALQKAFKRCAARSGLPARYSIHCLRHTYATFLLKASNHDYRFVQRQLGHTSIRTTQVYASVLESEGRKALERIYR